MGCEENESCEAGFIDIKTLWNQRLYVKDGSGIWQVGEP